VKNDFEGFSKWLTICTYWGGGGQKKLTPSRRDASGNILASVYSGFKITTYKLFISISIGELLE
jgi:hypothetical protein